MNLVVGAQSVLKGDGGPAAAQAETAVQTNKTFLENLICFAGTARLVFTRAQRQRGMLMFTGYERRPSTER